MTGEISKDQKLAIWTGKGIHRIYVLYDGVLEEDGEWSFEKQENQREALKQVESFKRGIKKTQKELASYVIEYTDEIADRVFRKYTQKQIYAKKKESTTEQED